MKTPRLATLLSATLLLASSSWPLVAADAPAAAAPATPAAPGDPKSGLLQGKWEGVEVGHEADGKCTLTITGQAMHLQGWNQAEWYKATFTLTAATDPQQLVAAITDCPAAVVIGKSAIAIYKIEDGKLTIVGHPPGAAEAPKNFEGDATSRTFIFKKAGA